MRIAITTYKYIHITLFIILLLTALIGLPACTVESQVAPRELPTVTQAAPDTPVPTSTVEPSSTPLPLAFSGERAYADAIQQVNAGPRTAGSQAHRETAEWIAAQVENAGWQVEFQETEVQGQPVRNIIAKLNTASSADGPWVILGAHYDSRLLADHDPDPSKQKQAVPGANDGASGAAVLVELARTLPGQLGQLDPAAQQAGSPRRAEQIWLVFFDAEDNGRIPGWDWILGSRAFVDALHQAGGRLPDAAVIVDMIGDKDLQIPFEQSSDARLNQEIWAIAAAQGFAEQFVPEPGLNILDDHTPFLEAGIPAVDLIDFSYPYYHTTQDTIDKISPESLQVVGSVLIAWLKNGSQVFSK